MRGGFTVSFVIQRGDLTSWLRKCNVDLVKNIETLFMQDIEVGDNIHRLD